MNLFEIAEANATVYPKRFEAATAEKATDESAAIQRFADHVEHDGRVSVNMRPWVLSSLLLEKKHQNIYEWAEEQSDLSGRPVDEILREKLGGYYARRIAFESTFDSGRQFRYGALNIGGAGITKYGSFCVALQSGFPSDGNDIAYLKADSLSAYVTPSGEVDETQIAEDAAPHCCRHHLAALKHIDQIPSTNEDDWPDLLCSDSDYVEAIFLEEVTHHEVGELRVKEEEYQRLRDLAFADFGRNLSEGDRALAQDFIAILREANEKLIELRRV